MTSQPDGLALHPFRALRPAVDADRLGRLLCPPYDVIDSAARARLLAADPDNAVGLILPDPRGLPDPYHAAAALLDDRVRDGRYRVDDQPALYVYEMQDASAHRGTATGTTRGLVGAVELRDPADGVILPHENTMAGPVADRLALMDATQADLEAIYLVYDGGGAASQAVQDADRLPLVAQAQTPDAVRHRLWAITDPDQHAAIRHDLAGRRALIADGHHRYATYRQLQQRCRAEHGVGPWDRGLTLLVDSLHYGPQVHAIHRVLPGISLDEVLRRVAGRLTLRKVDSPAIGLARAGQEQCFAVVLCGAGRCVLAVDSDTTLAASAAEGQLPALTELDVSVLHRGLIAGVLSLRDGEETVGYAHDVNEALRTADETHGTAVLLRPTPVGAVAAVAAAGGRMPRKSTLFTPKPASGLLLRRFVDELPAGR